MDTTTTGYLLAKVRIGKDMTIQELSRESGVGHQTISSIEHGRHMPRISTVRCLASALGVKMQSIIGKDSFYYGKVCENEHYPSY